MWLSESLAIPNGGGPIGSREYTPLVDDSGRVIPVERAGFAPDPEPIPASVPPAYVYPIGVPAPAIVVPLPETLVEPGFTGLETGGPLIRTASADWMATRPHVPANVEPVPFTTMPVVSQYAGAQPTILDRIRPGATTMRAIFDTRTTLPTMYPTPEFTRRVTLGPSTDKPPQALGSTTRVEDKGKSNGLLVGVIAVAALVAAVWYTR